VRAAVPVRALLLRVEGGPAGGQPLFTIVEGREKLHAFGGSTLQVGALPIRFELA
jgi:hypothetical protein